MAIQSQLASEGARDAIVRALTGKLLGFGWQVIESDARAELACFEHLLPGPDLTFTVSYPGVVQRCPVAFHFADGENALRYACTVRRPGGEFIREHGRLDLGTGSMIVESVRGDWNVAATARPGGAQA